MATLMALSSPVFTTSLFRPSSSSSLSTPLFSQHLFSKLPRSNNKIRCCSRINKEEEAPSTSSSLKSLDPKKGVSVYKPKSYQVLVTDAANSLAYALQDGFTRLEIDFP